MWKCPSLPWPHPKPLALSLLSLSPDVTLEVLAAIVFLCTQYTHSVSKVQLKRQFLACVLTPRQKQSLPFLKNMLCVPLIEHLLHGHPQVFTHLSSPVNLSSSRTQTHLHLCRLCQHRA